MILLIINKIIIKKVYNLQRSPRISGEVLVQNTFQSRRLSTRINQILVQETQLIFELTKSWIKLNGIVLET